MTARDYVVQTTDPSIATTKLAVQEMTAAGFATTWLATREPYTDARRKTRMVEASLFPGYLMVEFDVASQAWRKIVSCRGVFRILGADPLHPTALPLGAVDQLRRRFEAGEFRPKPAAEFSVSERLQVTAGPFQGHVGVCKLSRGERVEVLLKLFDRDTPLTLRRDMLRRAS